MVQTKPSQKRVCLEVFAMELNPLFQEHVPVLLNSF